MVSVRLKVHIPDIGKQGVLTEIFSDTFNAISLARLITALPTEILFVLSNQFAQCGFKFPFNIQVSTLCNKGYPFPKFRFCILLFLEGFADTLAGGVKIVDLITITTFSNCSNKSPFR